MLSGGTNVNIFHILSCLSKTISSTRALHRMRAPVSMLAVLSCAFVATANAQNEFTLTPSANPVQVGQPVDLLAMVGPVPPGTNENFDVTFYDTSAGGMNPNGIPGTLLCTNVPAPLVGSQWVGHCVTSFDTIGTHVLVASSGTAPDIVITTDELDEEVTAPVAFDANQFALTGSWYNPATSGQGLELQ